MAAELGGYKALFFEEIDGQRRKIALRGTEAPLGHPRADAAFELGGSVRRKIKFEPGSQAPVVHIMGTQENDLRVRCHFRETVYEPYTQGHSKQRMEEIDAIRLAARTLRIVWGGVLRRGLLRETHFGIESVGEITAELMFDVFDQGVNSGGGAKAPSLPSVPTNIDTLSDATTSALSGLSFGFGLSTDFRGALDGLTAGLLNPLSQIVALGEDLRAGVGDLTAGLKSIATSARTILDRARDLSSFLGAQSDPTDGDFADVRAGWQRARADALVLLQQVVGASIDVGVGAERALAGQSAVAAKTYTVRGNETLEMIARRVGSSLEAIRALNPALSLAPLRAGTVVKLP